LFSPAYNCNCTWADPSIHPLATSAAAAAAAASDVWRGDAEAMYLEARSHFNQGSFSPKVTLESIDVDGRLMGCVARANLDHTYPSSLPVAAAACC